MNTTTEAPADLVRNFIQENFILGAGDETTDLGLDQSLSELGMIDSSGVLEIIDFLEETFSISISDEETIPENLDSINKIVAFVDRKRAD